MLMRALLVHIAHEIAGAARIRHSLRPLNFRRSQNYLETSGATRRENVFTHPGVIVRLDRTTQMLWGRSGGEGTDILGRRDHAMENPMSQSFDASRSLTAFEQDSTLVAVIEMSQSKWLVAAVVPGIARQP